MKLKTNKLLTLTLATGLVAMTAGCGASNTPAKDTNDGTGTPPNTTPPVTIDPVTYAEWAADATIADDDTDNAFLAGVAATTNPVAAVTLTGLTAGTTVETLNLRSQVRAQEGPDNAITRTQETLGGAATNGVAFATIGATDTSRYFAGVIAGTNLGAPLTTTTVTGTWAGLIQAISGTAGSAFDAKAFELTVTFGTTDAARTISAHVAAGADFTTTSYYLSGTYDADGVITGTVSSGVITNDATGRDAATETGTLSGLIGLNGAVGAFYSTAETALGYAGGFVASKAANLGGTDPDNVYADWAAGATQAADTTGDNAFLAGTGTGLTGATGATLVAIDLADVVTDPIDGEPGDDGTPESPAGKTGTPGTPGSQLGGDATNGVAFGTTGTGADTKFFAGLLNTTDLGAPISATPVSGTWNGLFQAVGATGYAVRKAFVLTVTFDADGDDTIAALIPVGADAHTLDGDDSYYISGTYDENGVITGNILYGDFATGNTGLPAAMADAVSDLTDATATGAASPATDGLGELSGLIGQDGAVGVFYSNAEGMTGYAGGFVASTDTVATPAATPGATGANYVVDYAKWDAAVTEATGLTANGFVAGTASGGTGQPSSGTVTIDRAASAAGGVSFFRSGTANSEFYHAAIHNDTNLGAPASTTTGSATWEGNFGAVGEANYVTASRTAMFAVTFGSTGGTIQSTVAAGTATFAVGMPAYHINATYTTAGLISGNILHQTASVAADAGVTAAATGTATAATAGFGTVTGLIGADGLVGVFHSSSTHSTGSTGATGFSGGFVAVPPASP